MLCSMETDELVPNALVLLSEGKLEIHAGAFVLVFTFQSSAMQTCFMNHGTKCSTSLLPAYVITEKLYKYSVNSAYAIC